MTDSLRVQHGIVEMFRYLFPEEFEDTDNPVLDHGKWEPGDECHEWDSDTIVEIADTIRHLYGIAEEQIEAASEWRPVDWARQLLETVAERLCDEDITDGSQYNAILAELYEWWEVVECEGDWDMFGGPFADSIERAFLLQRKDK
jgi:hypothetical protein